MSKKIIFITLLFCGLAFSSQSQSLTYSKVILLTSLDTVPQGKVWKVTTFFPSSNWLSNVANSAYSGTTLNIRVNGAEQFIGVSKSGSHARSNNTIPFPIWLPAGTTLEPSTNCGSLSIIEFTENNQ